MRLVRKIHKQALELDACDKFTGKENFNEIVDLLFSTQGIEFCTNNNFPSLEYFEQFNQKDLIEKGIYINAGTVEIENKEIVLLAGNTNGVLKYNNIDKGYKVILMHNASAEIKASDYAVVFLFGDKDDAEITVSNNAIVK